MQVEAFYLIQASNAGHQRHRRQCLQHGDGVCDDSARRWENHGNSYFCKVVSNIRIDYYFQFWLLLLFLIHCLLLIPALNAVPAMKWDWCLLPEWVSCHTFLVKAVGVHFMAGVHTTGHIVTANCAALLPLSYLSWPFVLAGPVWKNKWGDFYCESPLVPIVMVSVSWLDGMRVVRLVYSSSWKKMSVSTSLHFLWLIVLLLVSILPLKSFSISSQTRKPRAVNMIPTNQRPTWALSLICLGTNTERWCACQIHFCFLPGSISCTSATYKVTGCKYKY